MNNEILLSDAQVAMDEVLRACNDATHRCAECADILQEEADELSTLLHRAAREQGSSAAALRETISRTDHPPPGEDDEKELLTSLAVQLRAIVSPERITSIIEACLDAETQLLARIKALSAFELEQQLVTHLQALRDHVERAITSLEELRRRSK